MAVRRILQVENPEDLQTLRTKAKRVTMFDDSLRPLVEDMIETMRAVSGVGLAAPQIGVLRRVVVIEVPAEVEELEDGTLKEIAPSELVVMINPEVIKASDEIFVMQEGCLSLPGRYGDVPRPAWVTLKYQDLNGKEQRVRRADATGYRLGRMAQHEIDHLEGILFTDHMADLSTLIDYRESPEKRRRRRLLRGRRERSAEAPNQEPAN